MTALRYNCNMEKLKTQTINKNERQIKMLARMIYDYVVGPNAEKNNNYIADNVTKNRLQEIQDINKIAYAELGEDGYVPIPQAEAWLEASPNMFPAAITNKETGKLEAYICMTPLKSDAYEKMKKGETLDVGLDAKDMAPLQKGKNNCLLMDVASMHSKLSRAAAATLFYSFLKNVAKFERQGMFIDNVIVDICTQMGFDSASLVLDMKKVRETNYEDAPASAGLYEGKIKPLLQKIEQEIQTLKDNNKQAQTGCTM